MLEQVWRACWCQMSALWQLKAEFKCNWEGRASFLFRASSLLPLSPPLFCVFMFLAVSSPPECEFDASCASCKCFTIILQPFRSWMAIIWFGWPWGWTKQHFCMLRKSPARLTLAYWLLTTSAAYILRLPFIMVELLYSLPATSSNVL
jgi:hypothetical protein